MRWCSAFWPNNWCERARAAQVNRIIEDSGIRPCHSQIAAPAVRQRERGRTKGKKCILCFVRVFWIIIAIVFLFWFFFLLVHFRFIKKCIHEMHSKRNAHKGEIAHRYAYWMCAICKRRIIDSGKLTVWAHHSSNELIFAFVEGAA